MTPSLILAASLLLTATAAQAQYNTRQNIEINCYGGRNQMELHVCTCDQGFISGYAALVLGNVTRFWGPGDLSSCLTWADGMNLSGQPTPPPPTPAAREPDDPSPPMALEMVAVPQVSLPEQPDVPDWASKDKLFNNWTGTVCDDGYHVAEMRLFKPAYVDRIETRINWSGLAEDVNGRFAYLHSNDHDMQVVFTRGTCSVPASGPDWCPGSAPIKRLLPAGSYSLNVFNPILCRNAQSNRTGFGVIWGTYKLEDLDTLAGDGMFDAPRFTPAPLGEATDTALTALDQTEQPPQSEATQGLEPSDRKTNWGSVAEPTDTDTPAQQPALSRSAIRVFSKVTTLRSSELTGSDSASFTAGTQAFVNIAPPWRGRVERPSEGRVFLAGDAAGTAPWHIDNFVVICIERRCVSAGVTESLDVRDARGALVRDISGRTFDLAADAIDLTDMIPPDTSTLVEIWALDFGGLAGVSDVYLVTDGGTLRRANRRLPPLTEKPPKLGMPGNRQGTGGGMLGRFGSH